MLPLGRGTSMPSCKSMGDGSYLWKTLTTSQKQAKFISALKEELEFIRLWEGALQAERIAGEPL